MSQMRRREFQGKNERIWERVIRPRFLWAIGGVLILEAFVSCSTGGRVVMAPPRIPGAEFIGAEQCSFCHDDVWADFQYSTHGSFMADGENGLGAGLSLIHI